MLLLSSSMLLANEVLIKKVEARQQTSGDWYFNVTLQHEDTGWEHYADLWIVEDADGKQIAKRVLWHPHVDEQPFTRGLGRVKIPTGTPYVFIKAHDSVDGWSRQKYQVNLK